MDILRRGSLQHIGQDLLELLKKVARSDELEFVRTNSNGTEKMEAVYFDLLVIQLNGPLDISEKQRHLNCTCLRV
jgi:hypothetical protein